MAQQEYRAVRGWLLTLWALVLVMVMVGGVTRLTGSGLSIVEWRPVSGVLPPLDAGAWEREFAAYRASPQFVQQNHWMTLGDFKRIFFWEYLHRLLGRTIGLVALLPWLYFAWRRVLTGGRALRTFSIIVLGGLQGVLGWWMVKSGLVHEPHVSHYRLALHLLLGIGVGQWILWQALGFALPSAIPGGSAQVETSRAQRLAVWAVIPLLLLQIVYGAFMAGTHAGLVAATFPDMNGHYAPGRFFTSGSIVHNLLDNPLSIHYLHRVLALGLLAHTLALAVVLRRASSELRVSALFLCLATFGQGALGALTVVLRVPAGVAVAHQGGAYVLSSAAVLLLHATLRPSPAPDDLARGEAVRSVANA